MENDGWWWLTAVGSCWLMIKNPWQEELSKLCWGLPWLVYQGKAGHVVPCCAFFHRTCPGRWSIMVAVADGFTGLVHQTDLLESKPATSSAGRPALLLIPTEVRLIPQCYTWRVQQWPPCHGPVGGTATPCLCRHLRRPASGRLSSAEWSLRSTSPAEVPTQFSAFRLRKLWSREFSKNQEWTYKHIYL